MKNMVIAKSPKISRRKFIVGSAAVASGGLALGLNVPFGVDAARAQGAATEINIWVAIRRASAPGAKWARAAAAGYGRRRIMFGVQALPHA